MNALRDWLTAFKPARITADRRERIRACIGALIGIFTTGITSYWLIGNTPQLPMLIAPLGASAVLLFAVPSGPLAQPWPIVGGNTLSAIVGVTALMLFDDVAVAAAVGVGGAIAVMFLTRSLHPPGGAVALATVLGGDAVLQQGYTWALVPVGLESLLLLTIGLLYNNLTGRRYPPLPTAAANPHKTADPAPGERQGFTQADLETVLQRYKEVLDVSPSDLKTILQQTELEAWRRRMGEVLCHDIMSRDLVTARTDTPLMDAWSRMHAHRIQALPVVDDADTILGIVTQVDLLEHAGLDGSPDLRTKLNGLLEHSGVPGAGCVGDIMTRPAETARADDHIAVLVPKLAGGGRHHIPIVDGDDRLVGIITQTDLVAALYHGDTPQG
ncbi:MAG: HPP family protein [Pseudazoarcus pumilus]|nr:HPP family protein [Pseudazoarcus pumilus]